MIISRNLHIFDLDDTLVNTKDAYTNAYADVIQKNINERITILRLLESILPVYGSSRIESVIASILRLFNRYVDEKQVDFLAQDFAKIYWDRLELLKGAKEYLESLVEQKKILALCSNGAAEMQMAKLKKFNLDKYFSPEMIFISGAHPKLNAKPYPDMLQAIMERSKISASLSCYYGNCLSDYLAATTAGIGFILMKGHEEKIFNDASLQISLLASLDSW